MSRTRARRDGRPTLIRGPDGPEPRSGIWKAKVRTSKFAGGSLSLCLAPVPADRTVCPWSTRAHTYETY
ncbi:hypothetical protein GCM10014715_40160 [Streptomyces spiralis]|uniref:Uncharacterized protein n=1 Tax=Streptomyces spiralis TaxID=66376 RepID=A0A919A1H4_9ACTN|nr:hypothetical protein GCM10014715_40160 [Streptomyces spiralis]